MWLAGLGPPLRRTSLGGKRGHMAAVIAVRYGPDKGASYSQATRPSRPEGAWLAVQRFLSECADVRGPTNVALRAYRATEFDSPEDAEAGLARAVAQFGQPDRTADGGTRWPSGELVPGGYLEWTGPDGKLDEFRDFVVHGEPWPKLLIGPVAAFATYTFLWRDLRSSEPLPLPAIPTRQDATLHNTITITLQRSCVVAPTLWFPYSPTDPKLRSLLRDIAPLLPFVLRARHFRAVEPSTGPLGFVLRRFDAKAVLAE